MRLEKIAHFEDANQFHIIELILTNHKGLIFVITGQPSHFKSIGFLKCCNGIFFLSQVCRNNIFS